LTVFSGNETREKRMLTFPQTSRALVTATALLTTGLFSGCGKTTTPSEPGAAKPGPTAPTGGPAGKLPDDKAGVAVGKQASKFKLKDQKGEERSLDDLRKKGKVAVVFFRSASW
jgi:cytochrome oxidase Cu insertion factor (SCO1/SenC/PrrC family)